MSELIERDITDEGKREIVMISSIGTNAETGAPIMVESVYTIDEPVKMFFRGNGGVTMRILDAKGVVHLVPGPGYRGTVHRWYPKDPAKPVAF